MKESRIHVSSDYSALAGLMPAGRRIFLIFDRNVSHLAGSIACTGSYALDASEGAKTMDTVLGICRWLMEAGADRDSFLLAMGGGVTADIAGFAACIYKRGIRFATLPTTLLSQVDAGIGGKNGVNLDGYKNILGIIRQPEFVFIATDTLKTLPQREFLSGVSEMLKTFIIADAERYRDAIAALSEEGAQVSAVNAEMILSAARIKESIVNQDETETGPRRVLNLGHTMAHALEWWRPGMLTHGEAVAIGIVMAARVSEDLGVCRPDLASGLVRDFAALGLPTKCPASIGELSEAITKDKKSTGDDIRYVLLRDIGEAEVRLMPKTALLDILTRTNA